MKQQQAVNILEEILGHELTGFEDCTSNATTCPIAECMLCAVRDCPGNEPLHYHHDGCPYCESEGDGSFERAMCNKYPIITEED
jgi:hypothetical protein